MNTTTRHINHLHLLLSIIIGSTTIAGTGFRIVAEAVKTRESIDSMRVSLEQLSEATSWNTRAIRNHEMYTLRKDPDYIPTPE
jgi:hypothetical protein